MTSARREDADSTWTVHLASYGYLSSKSSWVLNARIKWSFSKYVLATPCSVRGVNLTGHLTLDSEQELFPRKSKQASKRSKLGIESR